MTNHSHRIRVHLDQSADRSHDIIFGSLASLPAILDELGLTPGSAIVVTDSNVGKIYGDQLEASLTEAGWMHRQIVVQPGEGSKSFDSYRSVMDQVLSSPIDRRTPIISIGGGVVGDLAGFVAATALRGIPLVQIPTSLVAQVDSAIGGKTAINHTTGKNLIGAFYQPEVVLVDTGLLQTLPKDEWMDGLSEVVKYGLIADRSFAVYLLKHWDQILSRETDAVRYMVNRCAQIKADIVSEDETEQGRRAILNFGHTFGHAVERVASYSGVTHGQGVCIGMRAALHLSQTRYPGADFQIAEQLVTRLRPPATTPDIDVLMSAMLTDKKRVRNELRFILLRTEGEAVVEAGVPELEVRAAWKAVLR